MKGQTNKQKFIAIGVCFMGAGAALMAAVNPGVGAGLMVVGVAWIIIGLKKRKSDK
ncbi:MAG: hypothetical protein PHD13_03705 [Methanocellales archaeon]|nr:hypothetical protein [Methanocellales archaeon]MDD3291161.1 hypothetical protein [Methanocellales archaeon]MDD5235261.1 hypothetical protein [Methanocellales archaeon]MDD5484583.1 hypothetical protein [Methanocellales archaeon]